VPSDRDGPHCLKHREVTFLSTLIQDTQCSFRSTATVRATGTFARQSLQPYSLVPLPWTNVVDLEAQLRNQDLDALVENERTRDLDILVENERTLSLDLQDIPTSKLETRSIKWLLETSTDPEVFIAAACFVPQVEWPLDLDVSDVLHHLFDIFTSCVGFDGKILPSLEDKASACAMAISHLYYGCFFQAYPSDNTFLGYKGEDEDMLYDVFCSGIPNRMIIATTTILCSPDFMSLAIPDADSVPACDWEQLLHVLPYHFATGRVNGFVEKLAIAVISKLLSSPLPPSNQIKANCTLLACIMVGVQFDKKDIIRFDKRYF
jgi:hypothetical protein